MFLQVPSSTNEMTDTKQLCLDRNNMKVIVDEHSNILDENYLQNQFNEVLIHNNANEDKLISVETNEVFQDVTNIVQNETKENYNSTFEMQVPAAFRKSVFWPKKDLCTDKKRKYRSKIPSVLTSEQGIRYLSDMEESKRKQEETKEQKKRLD